MTRLRHPVAAVVVTAIAVFWTIPTFGLFVTSLRPRWEVQYSGWWTIFQDPVVTLENYRVVLTGGELLPDGVLPYLFNSLAIAVPATVFPIILGAMVAYAITAVNFRGAAAMLVAIIALQIIPLQMTLLPLLELFNNGWSIGSIPIVPHLVDPQTGRSLLAGRYITLWIVHTMFALPLCIFLMYSFGSRLSREVIDAAQIDGASHFLIFRRIYLPLMSPALATFAIFQFLWVWNDLLIAITFVGSSPNVAPITAYLATLKGGFGQNEHLLTAAAFVALVIPLMIFFFMQRYYARGFLPGAYIRDRSA